MSGSPAAAPGPIATKEWIGLAILGLGAIALRFFKIGQESFWIDEVFSLQALQKGIFSWLWNVEATPPLYFLLLKAWSLCFGTSHEALRGLSALCGGLAVPALYYCARKWGFSRILASAGALMLLIHPMAYWQSQQNRYYALLALLGTLWLASIPEVLDRRAKRPFVWSFLVFGYLTFATHYYFVFYVTVAGGAALASYLASGRDREFRTRLMLHTKALAGAMFTLLPLLVRQVGHSPSNFLSPPTLEQLMSIFNTLYWVGPWTAPGPWVWPFSWRIALILALYLLTGAGYAIAILRRFSGRSSQGEPSSLLPGLAMFWFSVVPILIAFLVSVTLTPIFMADRYTGLFLPPFLLALVAGWGLWPVRFRPLVVATALVAFGVLSSASIANYWTTCQEFDWRGAIRRIEADWREGDALVFCPGWNGDNYTNNGGTPRGLVEANNIAGMERAQRVWLFMWEQAPPETGRPQLQAFRESSPHTMLIQLPQMTLTLIEPPRQPSSSPKS